MAVVSLAVLDCRSFKTGSVSASALLFHHHRRFSKFSSSSSSSSSVCWCSKETHKQSEPLFSINEEKKKKKSGHWWLPIFGWAQKEEENWPYGQMPDSNDHLTQSEGIGNADDTGDDNEGCSKEESRPRKKMDRVIFTAEKAKLLRKNLRETSCFHDLMYHSAIASRLASSDHDDHQQ